MPFTGNTPQATIDRLAQRRMLKRAAKNTVVRLTLWQRFLKWVQE